MTRRTRSLVLRQGLEAFAAAVATLGAGSATADTLGPVVPIVEDPAASTPRVACAADGRCLVIWQVTSGAGLRSVSGRWLDAAGVPDGDPMTLASADVTGPAYPPSIAMSADGRFVLAYQREYGKTVLRWFDPSGSPASAPRNIQSGPVPRVALDPDGDAIVATISSGANCVSYLSPACTKSIHLRRYRPGGTTYGHRLVRSVTGPGGLLLFGRSIEYADPPTVAIDPDGDLLVTWLEHDYTSPAMTYQRVMARGYGGTYGNSTGPAFEVGSLQGSIGGVTAAAGSAGHWVVGWAQSVVSVATRVQVRPVTGRTPGAQTSLADPGGATFNLASLAGAPTDAFAVLAYRYVDSGHVSLALQRLDVDAQPVGPSVAIDSGGAGTPQHTGLALDRAARATAVWDRDVDGHVSGILARRVAP